MNNSPMNLIPRPPAGQKPPNNTPQKIPATIPNNNLFEFVSRLMIPLLFLSAFVPILRASAQCHPNTGRITAAKLKERRRVMDSTTGVNPWSSIYQRSNLIISG